MAKEVRKYRPSNGTESGLFMGLYCDNCIHEARCKIIMRSMSYEVDDSEYPTEWIYNSAGDPKCTKFSRMDE